MHPLLQRFFQKPELPAVPERYLSSAHQAPTRRTLEDCQLGYHRLLAVPGFWEGRAKIRREVISESQARMSEQDDEWLRISLSSQKLAEYERVLSS